MLPKPQLIELNGLSVDLGGAQILTDISFLVEPGEWVGLLGPNGSGKTTLLRAIAGLLPYRGSARVRGKEVRDWRPRLFAQELGFVRQSSVLSFDFRVDEIVMLGRAPHKRLLSPVTSEDRSRTDEILMEVDLRDFESRSMMSLSGGEQQRVFLAQALVQDPAILLLDEPTNHLDVHHQYRFCQLVRHRVDNGIAAIAAFHDLELAARFADRILVLRGGELAGNGVPREVLTPELIADVFDMRADVAVEADNHLTINYTSPLVGDDA